MRRVNVADFESRALTRQTARPKCRETALVRDLRQRVGLVHELRQLRRSEELANRGHHRLGVHQVVRHRRRHFLVHAHLFLDGAFHADQADAELVLQQLAYRANAAVAEVIDVVHRADVLAQLEQVADGSVEVFRLQRAVVEVGRVFALEQLDVELQAAHPREVVLPRIEEHSVEQRSRGVERRRIARTQLAVDLDQRFLRRLDRIAAQRLADDRAHVVALGEEQVQFGNVGFEHLRQLVGGQLGVGFQQHFAGGGVDHVGRNKRAFQVRGVDFDLGNLVLVDFLHHRRRDLAAGVRDLFATLGRDLVRQLHAQQVGGLVDAGLQRPVQLVVAQSDAIDGVERAQNVLVGAQSQRPQEDASQELALAVDAHVQDVLLVVLELDPRTAVRNDLAQEVGAVVRGLEEHARRAVQLADDHALGAVDDEGAVLRHQRNVAEEDFLLLHVADGAVAGLRVLVVDREPHGDLQRRGVRHAALFALGHVVLQLQAHRVAALVAEIGRVGVVRAALGAEHVAQVERIGLDRRTAVAAGGAQVVQPLEVAALALPVADGELDEVELRHVAEVGDGKDRLEHRLQSRIVTLARQRIHLQEAVVGTLLHLDEVRNLDGRRNLGKVEPISDWQFSVAPFIKLLISAGQVRSPDRASRDCADVRRGHLPSHGDRWGRKKNALAGAFAQRHDCARRDRTLRKRQLRR